MELRSIICDECGREIQGPYLEVKVDSIELLDEPGMNHYHDGCLSNKVVLELLPPASANQEAYIYLLVKRKDEPT